MPAPIMHYPSHACTHHALPITCLHPSCTTHHMPAPIMHYPSHACTHHALPITCLHPSCTTHHMPAPIMHYPSHACNPAPTMNIHPSHACTHHEYTPTTCLHISIIHTVKHMKCQQIKIKTPHLLFTFTRSN